MWVLWAIIRSWSASAGPEHMFGYVLPVRSRLTEQEWADYRAAYCGLCHTMKRRYGFLAQFLLNYDFTFLALLLRRSPQQPCVTCRRCLSAPIRGRMADTEDASLDAAADGSVLLVYWKLRDQLADERGLKKLAAAGMLGLFHGVFRRGKQRCPDLHREIGERLAALRALEQKDCPSVDRTADQFARIMTAMVPQNWDEISQRTTEQILYHLGRWIYLIDAWDDLEDDLKESQYNPIAARFSLREVPEQDRAAAKEQMERTICHSENLAISAFHLGEFGYYAPVLENILCAGLQSVRQLVFSGEWKTRRKQKKQELNQR